MQALSACGLNKAEKYHIKPVFVVLYTFLLILLLPGCSSKPGLNELGADATILAFGDSLTYGTGTSRENAYPAVLEKLIHRKVINAGVPGEISAQGLTRLPRLLEQHQPDLVILCHGGNDILRKMDLSQTRANIQQMVNIIQTNHAQVVLVAVPEFSLFLGSSPLYQELADENQLPLEDDVLSDILGQNRFKSDHIHPNTEGYQILANKIAELLSDTGAI